MVVVGCKVRRSPWWRFSWDAEPLLLSAVTSCVPWRHHIQAWKQLLSFHSPHSAPSATSSTRVTADGRPHHDGSIAICQSSATICDPRKLVFSVHVRLFYGKSQSTPSETPRWQQGGYNPTAEWLTYHIRQLNVSLVEQLQVTGREQHPVQAGVTWGCSLWVQSQKAE